MGVLTTTRGFIAYPKRVSLEDLKFTRPDSYLFGIVTLIVVVAIVTNILVFGRAIVPDILKDIHCSFCF